MIVQKMSTARKDVIATALIDNNDDVLERYFVEERGITSWQRWQGMEHRMLRRGSSA